MSPTQETITCSIRSEENLYRKVGGSGAQEPARETQPDHRRNNLGRQYAPSCRPRRKQLPVQSDRKKISIERWEGQGLRSQLAKHNLTIDEITSVVNTHLHVAHAGNNYLFNQIGRKSLSKGGRVRGSGASSRNTT